jgi:peptidoglycan L-alanyl-D-glutamate endopeptidase CwlK
MLADDIKYTILMLIFLLTVTTSASSQEGNTIQAIPAGLQRLLKAYPDHLVSADGNSLRWKDGTTMIFDDGIMNKNFETMLKNPDLEDQMSMRYPVGQQSETPLLKDFDPGRVRYQPFFLKMYGDSATKVQAHLVPVIWLPKTARLQVMITSVNGVNEQLQAVSNELDALPDPLKKYVNKLAGTFYWRDVAGTERLSPHSFGIAIDINTQYADYWQWDAPNPNQEFHYKNRIPPEIIAIFEKHGFIWGGKWYHYDTMHFEYRPELLVESN